MAGVELGSAFISVGLGTNKLGPEIKKVFGGIEGDAGAAGATAGKSFSGKFSGFMKSASLPAAGVLGGIGLMASNFGELAATAEQNVGAVETVFGRASDGVGRFAENSAKMVGLSSSSYNELSAVTGSALKSAGVPIDELAAKNDELITRGADLASVFGGDTATAVGAMGAAFRGEFDTLEQYGVNLSAEAINAELAARGQENLGGAAGEAAKKQAIMDLIMEKSAGSAGNFAKESDTAAGAQQRSTAAWEDASAKLGEALLPIMTTVATKFSEMATWMGQNAGLVTGLAIGIGILAGVIAVWSVVQGILNLVMLASPITWIVLGIVALIAAIVLLVMNWDTVVAFLTQIWGGFMNWIVQVLDGFLAWWNQMWGGFGNWIKEVWDGFVSWITNVWNGFMGWIQGVLGGFVGWWNGLWAGIGAFISKVWNNIVSWVTGAFNNVWRTIVSVAGTISGYWNSFWGTIGAKIGQIWESIKTGVSRGIDGVVGFVRDLPGKVLGFFSNAGTLLLDAGGNIIEGFLKGLQEGFEGVKDFVGGIGDWIAKNKGPKAYDLALLVPAGGWIMDGLEKGIEGSLPSLQRTLGGVSATIAAGIASPRGGTVYTPAGAIGAGSGNTYNTTINQVDDPVGTSHAVQRRLGALAV